MLHQCGGVFCRQQIDGFNYFFFYYNLLVCILCSHYHPEQFPKAMYSFLSFHFILLGSINFLKPRLLVYCPSDSFSLVASVCFPFSSVYSISPCTFYSSGLIAMNPLVYTCYRMFLFFLQLQKIALLYVGIGPDIVFWSLKYVVL